MAGVEVGRVGRVLVGRHVYGKERWGLAGGGVSCHRKVDETRTVAMKCSILGLCGLPGGWVGNINF